MNIGLFLGSFNPVHNGHIGLAQYILEHTDLSEIWLVVSPNNPLKDKSGLLDKRIRLQLVSDAVKDFPGLEPCDIELSLPLPSYTVNTLKALTERYPQHRFTIIIGSDNMSVFHRWRQWEYIYNHYGILVYPRQGDDLESLQSQYPKMRIISGAPLFPVSSTKIRDLYKQGGDFAPFVPKNVYNMLSSTKNLWE